MTTDGYRILNSLCIRGGCDDCRLRRSSSGRGTFKEYWRYIAILGRSVIILDFGDCSRLLEPSCDRSLHGVDVEVAR